MKYIKNIGEPHIIEVKKVTKNKLDGGIKMNKEKRFKILCDKWKDNHSSLTAKENKELDKLFKERLIIGNCELSVSRALLKAVKGEMSFQRAFLEEITQRNRAVKIPDKIARRLLSMFVPCKVSYDYKKKKMIMIFEPDDIVALTKK